jgi:hypothetical protein
MEVLSNIFSMAQGLSLSLKLVVAVISAVIWFGLYGLFVVFLFQAPASPTAPRASHQDQPAPILPGSGGQGGRGGDARVVGSGTAIGGPGGHGGGFGRGGDGGSPEMYGDGHAAGGAGGSVNDEGIWRHPAKSGYEVHQRALGLPVDPRLRPFGRGGAAPGYEPKLKVVEQLRDAYFRKTGQPSQSIFENVNAVPLDYLNNALKAHSENWRVRVVYGDEYEFYVPHGD